MDGWIKLHRKITEWEWYKDTNTFRLFLHLLLKAQHKETKYKGETIKSGEVVTGRKILAQELALSEAQIRTSISKLKSTNEITTKSTNQYSIITLKNWKLYQTEQPTNQLSDSQQIATYKNEKNEKNSSSITRVDVYGEYDNVYMTPTQHGQLLSQIMNKKALDDVIDELSEAIATGRVKEFNENLPNAHFIMARKFWTQKRNKPRREVKSASGLNWSI